MKRVLFILLLAAPTGLAAKKQCKVKKIFQSDIPFVTTGAGRYILCEDITYGENEAAITLGHDNVQLFLLNHEIQLTNAAATGILVQKGDGTEQVTEILIENDAIENSTPTTGQTGIGIDINNANKVALQNICTMQNNIGLRVQNTTDIQVSKSSFIESVANDSQNGGIGCLISNSSAFTFDNCIFKDNTINMKIEGQSRDGKIFTCSYPNSLSTSLQVTGVQGLLIKDTQFSYATEGSLVNGIVQLTGTTEQPLSNVRLACCTVTNLSPSAQVTVTKADWVHGLLIDTCMFDSAAGGGIDSNTIDLTGVENFIVRDSSIHGTPTTPFFIRSALLLSLCKNGLIDNNIIKEGFVGLRLLVRSEGIIVKRNTICQNANRGINLSNECNYNTIVNNHVNKNGGEGILFLNSNFNVVKNNTISENTFDGIKLDSSFSNTIVNNDILGNLNDGIFVFSGTENLIQRNRLHNNGTSGIDNDEGSTKVFSNVASKNPTFASNYQGVPNVSMPGVATLGGHNISSSP